MNSESAAAGDDPDLPERPYYLVLLTVGPVVFMLHFLLTYVTAAVWCARFAGPGAPLGGVATVIAVYTAVALVAIGSVARLGARRHHDSAAVPHDRDTPQDRGGFLGFATLLLAGLSAIATLYVATATIFFPVC